MVVGLLAAAVKGQAWKPKKTERTKRLHAPLSPEPLHPETLNP